VSPLSVFYVLTGFEQLSTWRVDSASRVTVKKLSGSPRDDKHQKIIVTMAAADGPHTKNTTINH
jgi:hypothetical protein